MKNSWLVAGNALSRLFMVLLIVTGLPGCASESTRSNRLNQKGQPAWVSLGNGPMQSAQGRLFQGVGSASLRGSLAQQTTIANNRARAALRKVFISYLEVVSRDFIATDAALRSNYQHHSAQQDIKSIFKGNRIAMRIVGHWADEGQQRLYAVAELKSTAVKDNIKSLIQLNSDFKNYLLSRSDRIFDRVAGQLD